MSPIIATTTLTLLRGGGVDDLGDETTVNDPVTGAERVPASLIERDRMLMDPTTGEPRTITQHHARLIPGTFPAVKGDRVRDESTGELYVVEDVKATARAIGGLSALRLILSKTSG